MNNANMNNVDMDNIDMDIVDMDNAHMNKMFIDNAKIGKIIRILRILSHLLCLWIGFFSNYHCKFASSSHKNRPKQAAQAAQIIHHSPLKNKKKHEKTDDDPGPRHDHEHGCHRTSESHRLPAEERMLQEAG